MINEFASSGEPDAPPGRRLGRVALRGLAVASVGALAAPLLGAAAAYATTFTPVDASPGIFQAPVGDQAANSYFAESVALDSAGTIAVVGAAGFNSGVGRVYVYSRSVSAPYTWTLAQTLNPSGGAPSSWFGHSVAISPDGNEIVVGAPGANSDAGLAYVYATNSDNWATASATSGATLAPSNVVAGDSFGTSLAISDATAGSYTIAVGAPADQSLATPPPPDPDPGSVHVFTGTGTTFLERTILNDNSYGNQTTSDGVGESVAVSQSGSEILVGAPGASAAGTYNDQGMAMVFNSSIGWTTAPTPTFINAGTTDSEVGFSVALDSAGNLALIGAPDQNGTGADAGAGAAYVFSSSSGSWSLKSTLTSNDGSAGVDQFGQKVSLSGNGNVALVGAPDHAVGAGNAQPQAGAAYLFDSAGNWTSNGPSTGTEWTNASNGQAANNFGFSVSLSYDGSTVLVGALDYGGDNGGTAEPNVGAAYGLAYSPIGGSTPSPSPSPTPVTTTQSSGSNGSGSNNSSSNGATTTTVAPAPVLKATTFTKLALAVTFSHKTINVVHGKTVALRVVLRGTSGYPNGRIVVRNGKKAMCSPKLSKGVATCRLATSSLAIGRHSLKVTFAGGVTYAAFTDSVILKVLR